MYGSTARHCPGVVALPKRGVLMYAYYPESSTDVTSRTKENKKEKEE